VKIRATAVFGNPSVNTIVVDDGVITGLISEDPLPGEPVWEGVAIGGFRDAHIHPSGYAAAVTGLSVGDAVSFDDLRQRLIDHALASRPGVPVVASRLDEHRIEEGRIPTRQDLDQVLRARPIVIHRYCGHVATVNTSALTRAGIRETTPDPPGGQIDRDELGRPTGVLRETAVGLVTSALASDIPRADPDRLERALAGLAGLGITRIDAMVSTGNAMWCGPGNELDDLIAVSDRLPFDVDVFTICSTPAELEAAANRIRVAGGRMRWAGWKTFADGSLGGHTAAMNAPFADSGVSGVLRLSPTADGAMADATLDMGGAIAIHAIGDRANGVVLDFLGELRGGWVDRSKLRIEHASVLSPELVRRFADLGVTASVQPAFLASEADWLADRVGADRARWTYPFRSLVDAGVPVIAGSDSPVENPNPWPAVAAALDHPFNPAESLDVDQALGLYGVQPLKVGDPADVMVIDRHPSRTGEIAETAVLGTFIAGAPIDALPLPWPD